MSVNKFVALFAFALIMLGLIGTVSICFSWLGIIMIIFGIVLLVITGVVRFGKGIWNIMTKRKCPYCKKKISKWANVCEYCGKDLNQSKEKKQNTHMSNKSKEKKVNQSTHEGVRSLEKNEIMNKCPKCGTNIERDWKICPMCKTKLTKECPECGKNSKLSFKVCPYCGYEFVEKSPEENELILEKLKHLIEKFENDGELKEHDIKIIKENLGSKDRDIRYYALLAATYIVKMKPKKLNSELSSIKSSFDDQEDNNRVNSTYIIGKLSAKYPNEVSSIASDLVLLLYDESDSVQLNVSESLFNISKVNPQELVDEEEVLKDYVKKGKGNRKETIKNIKKTLENIEDRPMPW